MASAPGIVMTATTISFVNEWYDTGTPNFRIPVAGAIFSLFAAGISDINQQVGTGIAILMFIGVMVTPVRGRNSPMGTLASLAIAHPQR